eukprot:7255763-Pyramimonas_sp.AAC.1
MLWPWSPGGGCSPPAWEGWTTVPVVPLHPSLLGPSLATSVGRAPLEKLRDGLPGPLRPYRACS